MLNLTRMMKQLPDVEVWMSTDAEVVRFTFCKGEFMYGMVYTHEHLKESIDDAGSDFIEELIVEKVRVEMLERQEALEKKKVEINEKLKSLEKFNYLREKRSLSKPEMAPIKGVSDGKSPLEKKKNVLEKRYDEWFTEKGRIMPNWTKTGSLEREIIQLEREISELESAD